MITCAPSAANARAIAAPIPLAPPDGATTMSLFDGNLSTIMPLDRLAVNVLHRVTDADADAGSDAPAERHLTAQG
jgi:hypothetical protein